MQKNPFLKLLTPEVIVSFIAAAQEQSAASEAYGRAFHLRHRTQDIFDRLLVANRTTDLNELAKLAVRAAEACEAACETALLVLDESDPVLVEQWIEAKAGEPCPTFGFRCFQNPARLTGVFPVPQQVVVMDHLGNEQDVTQLTTGPAIGVGWVLTVNYDPPVDRCVIRLEGFEGLVSDSATTTPPEHLTPSS